MSARTPTPEQQDAIETLDRNLFVSAGAGTGKTFVLIEHYLQLLRERRAGVSGILAITFTDKATREMVERIRSSCLRAAQSDDPDEAAFWRRVRHDLDGARISTIHGMCSSILKEYPLQAGVDPAFHVLDSGGESILLREAVEAAVEKMLDCEDEDFLLLAEEYNLGRLSEMLRGIIGDAETFNRALKVMRPLNDEDLIKLWREEFDRCRAEMLQAVLESESLRRQVEVLRSNAASDPGDTMDIKRLQVLEGVESMKDQHHAFCEQSRLAQEIIGIDLRGGSKKKWDREEMFAAVKTAISVTRKMLKICLPVDENKMQDPARTAALARALGGVGRKCLEEFEALKSTRGGLSFDDLQIKARDLLRGNADIRNSIRAGTKAVLVDEFQDINPIQKEIIFLLCGDGPENPHLMVVGDAKQSIYRFRGADVSVFNRLRAEMSDPPEAESGSKIISIDRNFRTVADGVALCNNVFERVMPGGKNPPPYYAVSEPATAHREKSGGPCAELLVARFPNESAKSTEERRAYEAEMVAEKILELKSQGRRFGDIAVLLRTIVNRDRFFEKAFSERGIPCHITAGSGFYGREEIIDLVDILRFTQNPLDDGALLSVLRSPMFGLDDNTLFWIGRAEGEAFRDRFYGFDTPEKISPQQSERLRFARATLERLPEIARRETLSRFLTKVLEITDYEAVLLSTFLGERKLANVNKLVETAFAFEDSGVLAPGDFIDYIDDLVENETRQAEAVYAAEDEDVVRLMTVHKAKGLEFPVVILPDIISAGGKGRDKSACALDPELGLILRPTTGTDEESESIASSAYKARRAARELAEEKRVMYVAMTRAQDLLIMTSTAGQKSRGGYEGMDKDRWLRWLCEAVGIGTELEPFDGEIRLPKDKNGVEPVVRVRIFDAETQHPAGAGAKKRRPAKAPLSRLVSRLAGTKPSERPMLARLGPDTAARRRFSATELAMYDYCPMKFRYRAILGYPERPERKDDHKKIMLNPATFGTIAHEVFERLDPASPPGLDDIIRIVRGGVSLDEKHERALAEEMLGFAEAFLGTPLCAEIRAARSVRREAPFLFRLNGSACEGIIDLLYERPDGTLCVVDYKSDDAADGGLEEHARGYRAQLAAYVLAAKKISGGPVADPAIYFLRRAKKVDVALGEEPEELLSAIIDGIHRGRFERKTGDCRCGYGRYCHPQKRNGKEQ